MKKKLIALFIILLIVVICIIFVVKSKETKPEEILNQYIDLLNEKKYEEMYGYITKQSKEKINQEDFIKRNKNIFDGFDAYDIKIEIKGIVKD